MNKKLFVAGAIIIMIGTLWLMLNGVSKKEGLFSPQLPTPSEPPKSPPGEAGPKTFKFDSSTDLKQELETVKPQVLDSDFNE